MKHKFFKKIVAIVAECLSVGFLVIIVIPNFIRTRYETASNACIKNLCQIESAKEQWTLENGKTNSVLMEGDLKPYLRLDESGNLSKMSGGRHLYHWKRR